MIVGIDGRSLVGVQARRGVAHYTASLAGALGAAFPEDAWRLLVLGAAPDAPLPGVETVARRLPRRAAYSAAALAGRPRLDRLVGGEPDVVWAPAPAPLAVSREVPFVLTLHDLSFAHRSADYTAYERAWHRLGRLDDLARRADRVMAVSGATRDEALARWDLDPERIAVVTSGVTRPATPPDPEESRRRLGLPARYFLFVGALEPRKGPGVLAQAYARARRARVNADLVLVGTGRSGVVFDALPGIHRIRAADRPELEALYSGALALVMPSLAEGYGFPPLEAAACGTPSVVSDLPVFRETLGDAALRVPPGDEAALAEGLVRIAADDALRERLAVAAAGAIEGRTWEAAARAAHAILAEAAAR
jgi:glycosyltransferase involved in cell wall biosynthesis